MKPKQRIILGALLPLDVVYYLPSRSLPQAWLWPKTWAQAVRVYFTTSSCDVYLQPTLFYPRVCVDFLRTEALPEQRYSPQVLCISCVRILGSATFHSHWNLLQSQSDFDKQDVRKHGTTYSPLIHILPLKLPTFSERNCWSRKDFEHVEFPKRRDDVPCFPCCIVRVTRFAVWGGSKHSQMHCVSCLRLPRPNSNFHWIRSYA
jgi:hypothetical protein